MIRLIGCFSLFIGIMVSVAHAASSFVEYEHYQRNDGSHLYRNFVTSEVISVRLGSGTKYRNIYSDYDGKAIITIKVTRSNGTTYNKEIAAWFDEQDEAQGFVAMMNSSAKLDLYYDFFNNPLNGESKWEECGAIPLFCRKHSATIVNRHELTADKLWIFNRDTSRMTKVMPEMEERGLVSDNQRIFDGPRDPSNPNGESTTEGRDSSRAISV
ncbi:MAG: hypothetical protein A2X86_04240 [Bdellovibrionales bacterium GWA2_49_15]|nr:MAG: hypothetical protein A2X86_04240 [Bdellovibrionales bacterium GWA2_49_15]HAZ12784.1 hypothetical protein [Bdellovibrionales bacterium]